jgi:hypothetical protein
MASSTIAQRPEIVFTVEDHKYAINGVPVPSVTQVLGVLDKPALPPWAAKVTLEGVCNLIKLSKHTRFELPEDAGKLKYALKRRKLDHYSVVKASQERGTAVHKALEDWITHHRIPRLKDYPVAQRGYIQGLTAFLIAEKPEFLASEKQVGSVRHGYAGTLDTVCFVNHTDKGRVMLDLKTSKDVWYLTQFPQLAAYELANVECGGEPTDAQGIVRVSADGQWEVKWSCADADDFLAILAVYKSQHSLTARWDAMRGAESN